MAAGTGFPYVLYDLLKKESSSVVMWTSTGTAFGIRDMQAFRQDVLTCYFKHNKFSSFQRQLNLYGFRKVVKGRESGCYMHPSFLRDNPEKLTEVKRGVVPPCPPHYSRKIYGSGPRFMSQDDGSDSEPELVVQPRGHWDKSLGATDVATHMRLGEMHMSAAAFAAARAQIKGEVSGMNSEHAKAAALAAHHLQAAQAHMHGVPGDGRGPPPPPGMGMGRMGPPPQQGAMDVSMGPPQHQMDVGRMGPPPQTGHGLGVGRASYGGSVGGAGSGNRSSGSADGGEGSRGRPGRTGLSKMFGANRPPTVTAGGGGGGMPSSSAFMGGGSGGSSQQPHLQQQMPHRFNAQSTSDSQGGGRGPMGSGQVFLPPIGSGGGHHGGMSMGGPGSANAKGLGDGTHPRPGQSSTGLSLSRLLEGLEQTLDSPLEEEMYTPIDKRNSFCAQMVNIAQVLEDDPSMQQTNDEAKSIQFSNLVQKRRSSVSELTAYLQDMLEEGESSRHVANMPGWTLPLPVPQGPNEYPSKDWNGNGSSTGNGNGNGTGTGTGTGGSNRVTFKRTHADSLGSYSSYGMGSGDSGGGTGTGAASGWGGSNSNNGERVAETSARSNPKRARPSSSLPGTHPSGAMEHKKGEGAGGGGEVKQEREGAVAVAAAAAAAVAAERRTSRRMSEARLNAQVKATPTVVQALTCLASGLPGHSDSEDSVKEGVPGGRSEGREGSSAPDSTASVTTTTEESRVERSSGKIVDSEEGPNSDKKSEGGKETEETSKIAPTLPTRRGSTAINDVLTSFSIDRALEQLKSDDGKEGEEDGGAEEEDARQSRSNTQKSMRHRASVYVLMHAIAAVDTSNDGGWEQEGQEPLDGVDGVGGVEEPATVASAI